MKYRLIGEKEKSLKLMMSHLPSNYRVTFSFQLTFMTVTASRDRVRGWNAILAMMCS
jgi:hypothetical protein